MIGDETLPIDGCVRCAESRWRDERVHGVPITFFGRVADCAFRHRNHFHVVKCDRRREISGV